MEAAVLFELRHNLDNGHLSAQIKLIAATNQLIDGLSDGCRSRRRPVRKRIVRESVAGVDACYLEALLSKVIQAASALSDDPVKDVMISARSFRGGRKTESLMPVCGIRRWRWRENRVMVLTGAGTEKPAFAE